MFSMNPMKKRRGAWSKYPAAFFLLFIVLQYPPYLFAETPQGNSCVACHEDAWEELRGSIHGQQGISCHQCHGGDPTKSDKALAKAPGTGYVGIPDKKQIVQVCGQCHADVEVMNFYGTRTDQLARYKTSVHGKKLLLEGDQKVAACSDCHGYHDVVRVTDPNSPVYPSNIPKTCNQCHGKKKLMDSYGLPSDIFDTYKSSVHGVALLEKKDISVAQCASCHGGHGAVPPGVKAIGDTCGKCHINEKKYFLESPHAKLSEQGKFSECISCHGNHGVHKPSPALYAEACVKCHAEGSPEFKQGQTIADAMQKAGTGLEEAEAIVKQASVEGLFVEEEAASLEKAKTDVISMAPLQHTLSEKRILALHDQVASEVQAIKQNIQEKRENLKRRKLMLIPIWIFVFIMVLAFLAKYKELERKKKDDDGHGRKPNN